MTASFVKAWAKSVWRKKKIYGAVLPHIFDQATDIGVIAEYYAAWQQYEQGDSNIEEDDTRPFWFFAASLGIVVFQRVVSTATIFHLTRSPLSALYQFLDVLLIKAVWVNYRLGLDKPCNPQRYIELMVSSLSLPFAQVPKTKINRKPRLKLHHSFYCRLDIYCGRQREIMCRELSSFRQYSQCIRSRRK